MQKIFVLNKLSKVYIKLVGGCFLTLLYWAVGRLVPNWSKGIRLSVLWSVGLWGLTVRCEQIGQIGALYLAMLFHLIKHILYLRSVDRGSCFYIPHKLQYDSPGHWCWPWIPHIAFKTYTEAESIFRWKQNCRLCLSLLLLNIFAKHKHPLQSGQQPDEILKPNYAG